jgi:uncharacterized protein (UPF0332 family)
MTGDNRLANAVADIASARDELRVAEAAIGIGVRRGAMSRVYYAVFQAARALLLIEGVESKTHAGLHRLVAEQLVNTGKLPKSTNAMLSRLQAYRQDADYAYVYDFDDETVGAELAGARAFVEAAAKAVSSFTP